MLVEYRSLPKAKKYQNCIVPVPLYRQLPSCSEGQFSGYGISCSFRLMISHLFGIHLLFEYLQIPQVMELQNHSD